MVARCRTLCCRPISQSFQPLVKRRRWRPELPKPLERARDEDIRRCELVSHQIRSRGERRNHARLNAPMILRQGPVRVLIGPSPTKHREIELDLTGIECEPADIGTATVMADHGTETCLRKGIRQIESDCGGLRHELPVMYQRRHPLIRVGIPRVVGSLSTPAQNVDIDELIVDAEFLQQPDETRGAGVRAMEECKHSVSFIARRTPIVP